MKNITRYLLVAGFAFLCSCTLAEDEATTGTQTAASPDEQKGANPRTGCPRRTQAALTPRDRIGTDLRTGDSPCESGSSEKGVDPRTDDWLAD